MPKAILLVGPQGSGKTTKAKEIISKSEQQDNYWINDVYSRSIHSSLSSCPPSTKFIVFDELILSLNFLQIEKILFLIRRDSAILVRGDEEEIISIYPTIILCIQTKKPEKFVNAFEHLHAWFEIIPCNYKP